MLTKNEAISILNSMISEENGKKIEKYINIISSLDDNGWEKISKEKSIYTASDVAKIVNKDMEKSHEFTDLNDLVSYGRNDNTIHIHVVPSDVRTLLSREGLRFSELQLIDAMEKIQTMVKENSEYKDILKIYAVSGIMKGPISKMFKNLGFDVKTMSIQTAKDDDELGKFYDIFKDKKDLGRAVLSKEVLLSDEWNELKDKRKYVLSNKKDLVAQAVNCSEKVVTTSAIDRQEQYIEKMHDRSDREKVDI